MSVYPFKLWYELKNEDFINNLFLFDRSSLVRLSCETTARLSIDAVLRAIREGGGRSTKETDRIFSEIRNYLHTELPTAVVKDVLDVCLARDRFRCHHNPTDCLALELWRVFFSEKFSEMSVSHHAFAFPKTTNYPDIVLNLGSLLSLITTSASHVDNNNVTASSEVVAFRRETRLSTKLSAANNNPISPSNDANVATISSFKLELKQCDVGCYLQVKTSFISLKLSRRYQLSISI